MGNFSWIPFYTEFANKLLDYKNNQEELIKKITVSLNKANLRLPNNGSAGIPEKSIDPFTVMGLFNRRITYKNRIMLISALKEAFEIEAKVPDGFDGIPVLNNLKSYFYFDNNNDEIKNLWEFFECAITTKDLDDVFIKKMEKVRQQQGIKWNITMGLFWINPQKFLNLDSTNRWYIVECCNQDKKIFGTSQKNGFNAKRYVELIRSIKKVYLDNNKPKKTFAQFSYDAFGRQSDKYPFDRDSWEKALSDNESLNKLTKIIESLSGDNAVDTQYNNEVIDLCQRVFDSISDFNTKSKYEGAKIRVGFFENEDNTNKYSIRDELLSLYNEKFGDEGTVYPKNLILYGPPGTGKTYSIKNRVETISGEKYDDLVKNGRLKFVTFHQSYGYEEFVEGIKPSTDETDGNGNIKYSVEPGVFKKFCDENRWIEKTEGSKDYPINDNPKVWKVSLKGTGDNDIRKECLENDHIRIGWDEYGENITDDMDYSAHGGKNVLSAFINKMRIGDIVLSCYSSTTIDAVGIVKSNYRYDNKFEEYKRVRDVEWLIKYQEERIFELNHRKPLKPPTVYELKISADDVLRFIEKDSYTKNSNPCFFIIDEINRGNISKIFGELITLIEESKRDKVSVTLPYSGEEFTVPSNVYVIGTMNTADRSIALLDTALRRRFDFEEMMPDPEQLTENCDGVNLKELLRVMNERIEYLLDREHTIGHAYFMESDENGDGHSINSLDKLKDVFKKKIIPLLQEYFYDDYEKISLVLGGQFVKEKNVPNSLKDKGLGKVYEINLPENITPDDFICIYNEDVNNGSNEGTDE